MQKEEEEERESGQAPRHHRRRAALFLCSQCGVGALSRRPFAQAPTDAAADPKNLGQITGGYGGYGDFGRGAEKKKEDKFLEN